MEAKTHYTIVGFCVVLLCAALLGSALWLSTSYDKKNYTSYIVYLNEAVSGLNVDSAVKYNGVPVGSVYRIKLNPNNPQQVRLLLHIERGTPITHSTFATLISQGITGTTFVGLSASSGDLTPLKKRFGEPFPVIPARPSLLNQLDHVLKEVSENVNVVSVRIKSVLDDENINNFKQSLANIRKFSNIMSVRANKLTKELTSAGENISSTMKAGKSALNKISGEAFPPTMQLLHKLNHVADNLEKVSNELRQNPSVIFRGTKPLTPGPGERK